MVLSFWEAGFLEIRYENELCRNSKSAVLIDPSVTDVWI